jgi:syntaxin 5
MYTFLTPNLFTHFPNQSELKSSNHQLPRFSTNHGMPFLDRTTEFASILQHKKLAIEPKKKPQIIEKSPQTNDSQKISSNIAETADLLTKLVKLIRKKTPFEDNTATIQKLSMMIKNRIVEHNRDLSDLDSTIKSQSINAQQEKHSGTVLNTLFTRLYYTKDQFETALKDRTKSMQKQQERSKNFITIEKPQPIQSKLNPEQTMMLIDRNYDDLAMRTEAIRDIEMHVQEVSGMFMKLGDLVAQQGELTQRISSNVSDALSNVEQGQEQLMQWYQKIASNRGLILKLFFILIVFIIFVAVFLL